MKALIIALSLAAATSACAVHERTVERPVAPVAATTTTYSTPAATTYTTTTAPATTTVYTR